MASIFQKGARVQTLANVVQNPAQIVAYQETIEVIETPLEIEIVDLLEAFFVCATGDVQMVSGTTFTIKRHDRRPVLRLLIKSSGSAMDLSTVSSAKFLMKNSSGELVIDQAAAIETPATDGIVRYDWQAGDTETSGSFKGEFELDYGGGDKLTVPNSGYLSIKIIDDLDDA